MAKKKYEFKGGDRIRRVGGEFKGFKTGDICVVQTNDHSPTLPLRVRKEPDGALKWVELEGWELVEAAEKKEGEYKFKVGDVIIGNEKANAYGHTVQGWIGVVTRVEGDHFHAKGRDDDSGGGTGFELRYDRFDLLEDAETPRRIEISVKEGKSKSKIVTAKLHASGGKVLSEAEARCSDDDDFDFVLGAKIAFQRLLKKLGEEKELKEEEAPKAEAFKPHLLFSILGKPVHYGNLGDLTNYRDMNGNPLRVGDTVMIYDNDGKVPTIETVIVNYGGKKFIMGVENACNETTGEIDGWHILKKTPFEDVPSGKSFFGIKYVKR